MIVLLCLALLAVPTCSEGDKVPEAALEYYEHGEFQRASEILSQRVRYCAESAELRLWLGKCLYRLRKWNDAIREFEKAVQIEPSNSQFHLWLGRAYGKKAEHSSFLTALGPARRLLKEFETAVKLSPANLDARFDLLEFYLDAPAIIGGGRDKAEDQVNQIAQRNRRLGYLARSRLYIKDKKWTLALQELTRGTEDFPEDPKALVDLADFLFSRSDFAGAADSARQALGQGTSRKARLLLSASQIRLGRDLATAEQSLREMIAGPLLDEDPPFEEIHFWLGEALLAQGKKLEAVESFKLALNFNPDYELARSALAQIR